MNHISKKLQAPAFKWRKVLKTLFLIEHLLKVGAPKCYDSLKGEVYQLRNLQNFSFIDHNKADKGETSIIKIKKSS
jgi:hypothetical protein